MRKLMYALVFLLAVIFLIAQFAEVRAIIETLHRGDWRFIFLAFGVQLLWLVNVAASYQVIFRATGILEKLSKLLLLSAAANFLNVVAPSAGMSGMAVFISEARRRGYSPGRVTVGGVTFLLFDYAGFLCILTVGLLVLFRRNNLNTAEIIATIVLLIQALALVYLLFLGMRSPRVFGNILAWLARVINRVMWPILRKPYLPEARAHEFAREATEGLRQLRYNRRGTLLPFVLALSNKALLLTIFYLMFVAFQVPVSGGTLVAGFSVMYLFFIVSITPSGIGVVEGVLTLVLRSMNVNLSDAVVVTLAYRGITLWIPLLYGFLAFRLLSHGSGPVETVQA